MKRDGMERADIDTALMADPKVVALARKLRDESKTMNAVGLYVATVLASWSAGDRLTLDEAAPAWWLGSWDDLADALAEVKLLDSERRVPQHVWDEWFAPARSRRDRFRELGSKGGRAAHGTADAQPLARPNAQPLARPQPTNQPNQPNNHPSNQARSTVAGGIDLDEPDHLDTWYRLTARAPSQTATRWLDSLADEYDEALLSRALAIAHMTDPDPSSLISRARDWMWAETHLAAKLNERTRRANAEAERRRIDEMPQEQRQANLARLRDQMVEAGLMTRVQADRYLNGKEAV